MKNIVVTPGAINRIYDKFRHGTATIRVSQSSSGYSPTTVDVDFDTPFADDNYTVAVTNSYAGGGDWNQIIIAISSKTASGFSIVANDNKTGSVTNIMLYVDWIAIHN